MSLHWFQPPTPSGESLPTILERLRPLGVRWHNWADSPHATYTVKDGQLVKDVGVIVVKVGDGTINVWPFEGITYSEMVVLAGCAQDAFENPPSKAKGWIRLRTKTVNIWRSNFLVRADESDDFNAQLIARSIRGVEKELTASILSELGIVRDGSRKHLRAGN